MGAYCGLARRGPESVVSQSPLRVVAKGHFAHKAAGTRTAANAREARAPPSPENQAQSRRDVSGEPAPRKPDLGVAELIEAAGGRRLTAAEERESEAVIQARAHGLKSAEPV